MPAEWRNRRWPRGRPRLHPGRRHGQPAAPDRRRVRPGMRQRAATWTTRSRSSTYLALARQRSGFSHGSGSLFVVAIDFDGGSTSWGHTSKQTLQMTSPRHIRTVATAAAERLPLLIDRASRVPLFDPTVYAMTEVRSRNRAAWPRRPRSSHATMRRAEAWLKP
jgi:hypothetical protein